MTTVYRIVPEQSASWQRPVKAILNTPAGGESKGDRYLVGPAGADGFVGQNNKIAVCTNATGPVWSFDTPLEGWQVYDETTNTNYIYSGAAWVSSITTGDITISDATPVLNFKDTSCTDSDVNASIQADATDTGSGTEDIDVTFQQQVAGVPTTFLNSDADGTLTIGKTGGQTVATTGSLAVVGTITGVTTDITGTAANMLTISVPDQGTADADGSNILILGAEGGSGGTGDHDGGDISIQPGAASGSGTDGKIYLNISTVINGPWTAASRTCADLGTVTTANIDGGTIDGVTIGGVAPAAGTFTSLIANGANGIELGKDDATNVAGFIKLWSAGAVDFYSTIVAATQTGNLTLTLPAANPGGTYLLNATSAGAMGYTDPATFSAAGALFNIVEDTTPQLGATLDCQEYDLDNVGAIIHEDATPSDFVIQNLDSDQDIVFSGNDGGSQTDIMKIDVSEGQLSGVLKATTGVLGPVAAGGIAATLLQNAAADLGAADVDINLGNTNGAYVTNLTIDGAITASNIGTAAAAATGDFVAAAGDTMTGALVIEHADGIELGKDDATNVAGNIKMWGAGATSFFNTFTAGTNTASAAYTLPTALPGSDLFLRCSSGGVLSWESAGSADAYLNTADLIPSADDTYYVGKNDDDSPKAFKGVILKDTTNGKYYRIEIVSGVLTTTDLTD